MPKSLAISNPTSYRFEIPPIRSTAIAAAISTLIFNRRRGDLVLCDIVGALRFQIV